MKRARVLLVQLGYKNIYYHTGDGSVGWKEHALYNRILVAAASPRVPYQLKVQLADEGIMVIPIGDIHSYQTLMIVRRIGNHFENRESIGCRFVPLLSDEEIL